MIVSYRFEGCLTFLSLRRVMKRFTLTRIILLSLWVAPISLVAMNNAPQEDLSQKADTINNRSVQVEAAYQILCNSSINQPSFNTICKSKVFAKKVAQRDDSVWGLFWEKKRSESNSLPVEELAKETDESYDYLLSFFTLSKVQNKKEILADFNRTLKPGGVALFNLATDGAQNPLIPIIAALLQENISKYPELQGKTLPDLLGMYSISTSDLKDMLNECGFVNSTIETKVVTFPFKTKEEYITWQRPLFDDAPLAQFLSKDNLEGVFNDFVDVVWSSLKTEQGIQYALVTTVVTAHKPS